MMYDLNSTFKYGNVCYGYVTLICTRLKKIYRIRFFLFNKLN